jgi:hypothetical protein
MQRGFGAMLAGPRHGRGGENRTVSCKIVQWRATVMKMGTTRSLWRYDAASEFAENRSSVAVPSRKHYVESA